MATEDKKEVSKEVLEVSAKLKPLLENFKVDGSNADIVVEADPYLEFMKEGGITKDTLKKVSDLNTTYIAGVAHAVSDKAIPLFKDNSDVKEINVQGKLNGRDSFDINVKREVTRLTAPGSKETTTDYGVMSCKVTTFAGRHKSGQLGLVRDELKAKALEALAE